VKLTFLLIAFSPAFAISQKNEKINSVPAKVYAKIGGGIMFPKGGDPNAAAFAGVGAKVANYFLLGIGGGIFRPPGWNKPVVPLGIDVHLLDLRSRMSPIAHIGAYKPVTSEENVTGRLYFTGGAGISFRGKMQQGGALMVNFGQLKYDVDNSGYVTRIDQNVIYVSFSVIL
jgi:hypothetical protein